MPTKKTPNAVYHHGIRWSVETTEENRDKICKVLQRISDKYIFQAELTINEQGEENPHFQGYFHTKKAIRSKQLARELNSQLNGVEIQPASTNGIEALRNYCMKDESRTAGPWADRIIYRGADLWPESKMPEWQQQMITKFNQPPGDRKMIWIYDPIGNNGKTKFIKYLVYKKDAVGLAYGHSTDVLNLVSKLDNKRIYAWNLTRSKPANLSELDLYSAMESVKDGFFINLKYETKQVLMNPPHVMVCANHKPRAEQISIDRWELYEIVDGRLESTNFD